MYARAITQFGLSKDEFFQLTLAQYIALADRATRKEEALDRQLAWTRSLIANIHSKRRWTWKDWSLFEQAKKKSGQSPEEMLNYVRSVVQPTLGGRIVQNGSRS